MQLIFNFITLVVASDVIPFNILNIDNLYSFCGGNRNNDHTVI